MLPLKEIINSRLRKKLLQLHMIGQRYIQNLTLDKYLFGLKVSQGDKSEENTKHMQAQINKN